MDGFARKGYGLVSKVFGRQLSRSSGGAAVAVYHRGEPVVDLWGGSRTEEEPWQADTVAMCFSTTKGVASTALHILADRGLVDYDAPVAEYWPEFAANGKESVTVRHVLTHSAGLHRIRSIVDSGDRLLDWDYMTTALAAAAPAYEPGTRHGYHALTYGWLVGEIVRRVSGTPITGFVDTEIAGPLGCDGLYIGLPGSERHRVAPLERLALPRPTNPTRRRIEKRIGTQMGKVVSAMPGTLNTRRMANALVPRNAEEALFSEATMDASIPAANGFFTARSLARMYAMIAGGGELDGVRLLTEERVRIMGEVQRRGRDLVLVMPMDWRLGYHRVFTSRGPVPSAFGHFGFGGSGAWADPERDLSVAFVCNRGSGTPVGDLRMMELGAAAVRAADRVASGTPEDPSTEDTDRPGARSGQ
ncbi:MAG: serine hydrolase domain-containing protein [Microthrixaceae bacterium]